MSSSLSFVSSINYSSSADIKLPHSCMSLELDATVRRTWKLIESELNGLKGPTDENDHLGLNLLQLVSSNLSFFVDRERKFFNYLRKRFESAYGIPPIFQKCWRSHTVTQPLNLVCHTIKKIRSHKGKTTLLEERITSKRTVSWAEACEPACWFPKTDLKPRDRYSIFVSESKLFLRMRATWQISLRNQVKRKRGYQALKTLLKYSGFPRYKQFFVANYDLSIDGKIRLLYYLCFDTLFTRLIITDFCTNVFFILPR